MPKQQPRKTIMVDAVKDRVNTYCSLKDIGQSEKQGACQVLESILHETNNYRGFIYPDFPRELHGKGYTDTKPWFSEHEYDRRYF